MTETKQILLQALAAKGVAVKYVAAASPKRKLVSLSAWLWLEGHGVENA